MTQSGSTSSGSKVKLLTRPSSSAQTATSSRRAWTPAEVAAFDEEIERSKEAIERKRREHEERKAEAVQQRKAEREAGRRSDVERLSVTLARFRDFTISPEREAEIAREIAAQEQFDRHQRTQAALQPLLKDIGQHYAGATLESYEIYDRAQEPIIARLRRLRDEMPMLVEQRRGLVFCGASGTGKDLLAAAMAIDAAKRHLIGCRKLNARRLGIAGFQQANELIEEFSAPELLILSDPSGNQMELDRLHELIDRRYCNNLPTWFTANFSTPDDAVEILGPAIWGRIVQDAETFACQWNDYRQRTKENVTAG